MKLVALLLAFSLASATFAKEAKSSAGGSPDKIDGCGLGWQVTNQRTMIATTTRGTTNMFVPPAFGMTSGTIGCDQTPLAQNERESAVFAMTNYDNLRAEMAQGFGESVEAFAQTFGCDSNAVKAFGPATQKHYREIFTSETPSLHNFLDSVKRIINQNNLNCTQA